MPTAEQPNIVVFFWDNFGWGELGCYDGGVLRDNAVVTGVGWAVFGLLTPGSSMLVAWADGPVRQDSVGTLNAPGSQRLILRFNPVEGRAVLEAA